MKHVSFAAFKSPLGKQDSARLSHPTSDVAPFTIVFNALQLITVDSTADTLL